MNKVKVIAHIVDWLKRYSKKSNTSGFVIGISGGIDSALTSTLCAKTGLPVICLNMPIRQHKAEYNRGTQHINWLKENFSNVSSHEIELTQVFETIENTFPKDIQDVLSIANTRARLRMLTLYAFAGNKKMLVAGTGNKIEDFGVGFFTKYGDGGVDISPIADLLKSQVYALSKELKIVDSILQAKPTDGLWADERSDEDQIGASYDELEWAMENFNSSNKQVELSAREKVVLEIYTRLNTANRHKMQAIPVCIIPEEFCQLNG